MKAKILLYFLIVQLTNKKEEGKEKEKPTKHT